MTTLQTTPTPQSAGTARPREVPGAVILAVIGALVVGYALWTWGAWLAAGPAQITGHRDPHDVSWWVARAYEMIMLVAVVAVSVHIVRACLRERRLVFDAVMVIAGFFTLFWDPMVNWMQPNFMYSSQWLNLNTWTGYAPGVVNPTASQMPQPVFIMFIYPFGLLAFAMVLNAAMSWAKRVRPQISNLALLAFSYAFGTVLGMVLEAPAFLSHLWALPGAPNTFALFGNGHRYPWAEYLTTGVVFTTFACVRFFKNDKGQTVVERGVEGFGTGWRTAVRILSTTAIFAMSMWVLLLVQIPAGLHSSPYPADYPGHLINDLCSVRPDQPTTYGPCPGTPGFRMPVKQTFGR
ncbi:spirocyclase AveC family protein [Nocardia sp. NPDC059246]|uniref:spirocyclase AveC family protein n=1 Tax=unclassified Nocardia TaxID=2637762 RepID=UPI0036C54FB6